MNYLHGKRLISLHHEMDSYERIISGFEKKAASFHAAKQVEAKKTGSETFEQREERLNDKKSEFKHLKLEAAAAKTMAQVQVRIEL
jgi:hypothetical protein